MSTEEKTFTCTMSEAMDGTIGICLDCGAEADCCEPDARKYKCESCGKREVYGLEEAILMGRVTF